MLRSIGKQSGESVESVREMKREATVGRICITLLFFFFILLGITILLTLTARRRFRLWIAIKL